MIVESLKASEEIKQDQESMKVEIQKEMKELLESTDKIERNLVPKIQADYSLLKREVKESRNEVE